MRLNDEVQQALAVLAKKKQERAELDALMKRQALEGRKKDLLAGRLVPRCDCLACVTAICDLREPDSRQCEITRRYNEAPEPPEEPVL